MGKQTIPPIVPQWGTLRRLNLARRTSLQRRQIGRNPRRLMIRNPLMFFGVLIPGRMTEKKAIRAWDKLKPDKPLCRVMYDALLRQKVSDQWTRDGGKYIPLFSTWLNGQRWEDRGVDLSQLPRPRDSGGWADDPEVCT